MTPRSLLLILALAGIVAGAALAAEPAFRKADTKRALEIGLRPSDLPAGWKAIGGRSPSAIDAGSTLSADSSEQCVGPANVAKTEADMLVTGAAMSEFSKESSTIVSIVLLFRSPGYALRQLDFPVSALKTCLTSELKKAAPGLRIAVASVRRYALATGSPHSTAVRVAIRVGIPPAVVFAYFDLVAQVDGRGMVETVYLGDVEPPAKTLELRLAQISASRIARYAG